MGDSFSWAAGVSPILPVTSMLYAFYEATEVADATSGFTFFNTSSIAGGMIGDELYISELSIKEVL